MAWLSFDSVERQNLMQSHIAQLDNHHPPGSWIDVKARSQTQIVMTAVQASAPHS
jgi:hypothetical protein